MQGWIKLHRQIREHWVWSRADYAKAFMDILMLVNHARATVMIKGDLYTVNPGESVRSIETWAKELGNGWTRQRVRTLFSLLEKSGIINQVTDTKTTRLSICNWETYQHGQPAANQQINQRLTKDQPAANQRLTTNKNDNNYKNENTEENLFDEPITQQQDSQLTERTEPVTMTIRDLTMMAKVRTSYARIEEVETMIKSMQIKYGTERLASVINKIRGTFDGCPELVEYLEDKLNDMPEDADDLGEELL